MSFASRLIQSALTRGLLQGTVTVAGAVFPCNHSPISTQARLTDGGLTPEATVTIIIRASDAGTTVFRSGQSASLVAADGQTYSLRLDSNEAAGNGEFVQLTARHLHQGA